MFEPFRCEDCVYGIYLEADGCWDSNCGAEDEEECEKLYQDDERM